ncbi:MAG: RHS repeat-associated core domain-containing protein [Bryobacterales bacterium]|nr:RHS repeat-associated core domain-containing protein [Bryobacterales bacterium]
MNGANRVAKVRKGETGSSYYMQNAVYNPAGALAGATLGLDGANQWTESRAYNSRLQARRVEVAKGANTLLRLRWAYAGAYNGTTFEETGTDNNGDLRIERLEFPHQGALQTVDRTYAYTGADRLASFSETGGKSQSFGHDAFGNVWQNAASGVPPLRQTGASWYLLGGTVNNRLANTTYDAAGNQTQLSVAAGTVASYDGEHRMSRIKAGSTEIASYVYDAEGRRVAKTVNGATTTYYFYDAAGQLMAEYGGPAQTAATQYFTTDYLGSTRMILSGTGNCLERLDYAPYGGQITRSGMECYGGASSEKPLFTGQMRDGESNAGTDTGQDYFNARYLWANIARFTSPDAPFADQRPEDGQSWNMYAYVRNNPLQFVDPGGCECVNGISSNLENDEDNGNACFDIDIYSDTPIRSEVAKAFSSVAKNAGPVVEALGNLLISSVEFVTPIPISLIANIGSSNTDTSLVQATAPKVVMMDPSAIRFTKDSISAEFRNRQNIGGTIDALRTGAISPTEITPIRTFDRNGMTFTLDNRRLFVASEAGTQIATRPATANEIAREIAGTYGKFSTRTEGLYIGIRGVVRTLTRGKF